jgi:hypothetical protein
MPALVVREWIVTLLISIGIEAVERTPSNRPIAAIGSRR